MFIKDQLMNAADHLRRRTHLGLSQVKDIVARFRAACPGWWSQSVCDEKTRLRTTLLRRWIAPLAKITGCANP